MDPIHNVDPDGRHYLVLDNDDYQVLLVGLNTIVEEYQNNNECAEPVFDFEPRNVTLAKGLIAFLDNPTQYKGTT